MIVVAQGLGKRFKQEWIFRNLDLSLETGDVLAIVGPNGSGKSTLIKIISGAIPATEGELKYRTEEGKIIPDDKIYQKISIAAPYLELIEELSLQESWDFHFKFKQKLPGINVEDAMAIIGLSKARYKQIKNFSSGMKQRMKLGLAFFSDVDLLLLDEPTSNLDKQGISVYNRLMEDWRRNRTLIIGSNQEDEYWMANKKLDVTQFLK
jgi:ABC-type multidrug transport system ATPase subunit